MFNSLESIYEEFGLQKNLSKNKLRNELKKRIVSIHSDKTGGNFPNDAVKQLYLRMQEAMAYLDSPTKINALEKRSPTESALEARVATLEISNHLSESSYEESAQIMSKRAGRQYRGGLISSGIFAAVCGSILAFSQKLSENSLFAPFVGIFWVRILILVFLALSGLGFVVMRIKELKLKRVVSAILSEDGIAWTVRMCINKYNEEPDCAITQRKLMDVISKCGKKWHKLKTVRWILGWFEIKVTRELAERIAKLQISSLIKRGVVRREGIRGIEPVYMLESSLAKEIIEDHGAILFEHELF
jgi:hypothetical protein